MEKIKELIKVGDRFKVDTCYYDDTISLPIPKLIEFLKNATDMGATHVRFLTYVYNDEVDEIEITPLMYDEESDEEFARRVAVAESKAAAAENIKKAREKALYEELKLKYDKS